MNSLEESPMACTPRISPYLAPTSTLTKPLPLSFSIRKRPATPMGTVAFLYGIPARVQLLLGATRHGHLGMGVDDRWDGLVTDPVGDAEHRVDGDDALAGGRVGEHVLTGDIAARPQPGNVGLALVADPDALGAEVDADLLQTQPMRQPAPDPSR